ncbi:hypothetical protein GGR52DRAFT_343845 [Hypoxylon sp. FL1284]|nr:hypothetical protein GGR52DRAFT_343845 [Hypoxylon sp. FL1284]
MCERRRTNRDGDGLPWLLRWQYQAPTNHGGVICIFCACLIGDPGAGKTLPLPVTELSSGVELDRGGEGRCLLWTADHEPHSQTRWAWPQISSRAVVGRSRGHVEAQKFLYKRVCGSSAAHNLLYARGVCEATADGHTLPSSRRPEMGWAAGLDGEATWFW